MEAVSTLALTRIGAVVAVAFLAVGGTCGACLSPVARPVTAGSAPVLGA